MSTRVLLFSGLFLMTLPWLGYRYIDEMKDFLVQGGSIQRAFQAYVEAVRDGSFPAEENCFQ